MRKATVDLARYERYYGAERLAYEGYRFDGFHRTLRHVLVTVEYRPVA